MYLHFSDWSVFMNTLDKKGLDHGDKIIKVYTSTEDPRQILGRQEITTLEGYGQPFQENEIFSYNDRESYSGTELEQRLSSLNLDDQSKERIRVLFRFANLPETQFCQYAMSLRNMDGTWKFSHPFEDIDGIDAAAKYPERRGPSIHLDIFGKQSLENLRKIVDIDHTEHLVERLRELNKIIAPKPITGIEGNPPFKEFLG